MNKTKLYRGRRSPDPLVLIYYSDETHETTNLKHIERHSPDGFEWGYGGSGPADLALSVLTDAVGKEAADQYYMKFKNEVIAHLPILRFDFSELFVIDWVKREKKKEENNYSRTVSQEKPKVTREEIDALFNKLVSQVFLDLPSHAPGLKYEVKDIIEDWLKSKGFEVVKQDKKEE